MSTDWQAGDVGVCIREGSWTPVNGAPPINGPAKGEFVKVIDVTPDSGSLCCGAVFIEIAKWPGMFWCSTSFRKIVPDTEPAKTGRELAEIIKRCGTKVPA